MKLKEFLELILTTTVDIKIEMYNKTHDEDGVFTTVTLQPTTTGYHDVFEHPDLKLYLDCEISHMRAITGDVDSKKKLKLKVPDQIRVVLSAGTPLLPNTVQKRHIKVVIPRVYYDKSEIATFIKERPTSTFIIYRHDLPELKVDVLPPANSRSYHFEHRSYIRRIEQIDNNSFVIVVTSKAEQTRKDVLPLEMKYVYEDKRI